MNTDELKLRLQSPEVKDNLKALLEIRTKTLKTKPGIKSLLKQNFVRDLVSLVEKPNSKVVDISLSILGNLLQEDAARAQIRSANGLSKLIQIVQNIEEESISCRAFRAIANAAQDQRNCKILHQHGVATLLAKCLSSATDVPNRLVLIRAVRIFGDSVEHKNYLATEGAVSAITNILASGAKPSNESDSSNTLPLLDPPSDTCPNCGRPRGDDGTRLVCDGSDLLRPRHRRCEKSKSKTPEQAEEIEPEELSEDVLKAATKCMAKISHECEMDVAQVLLPGVKVLVDLVDHQNREVAANSLTTIINLTQVAGVRPSLGNVGSIKCLVEKYEKGDLTDKEGAHVITALCLYCRESVNRMRLRDLGGCRLFVNVLNDGSRSNLHDRVINSLLQFIYDNHSLNVFMNEGLIQALVGFLEEHTEGNSVAHCCEVEKVEEKVEQMEIDTEATEIEPSPKPPSPVCDMEPAVNEENAVTSEAVKEDVTINVKESEGKPEADGDRHVFRVTSPSYQAVQHELQQFLLLRSSRDLSNLPQDSPGIDWNPSSPGSSYCLSPDRSPISLSCGYSPDRSPRYFHSPNRSYSPSPSHSLPDSPAPSLGDYSPPSSPPYSPPEPSYSPIENFSDDEDSNPVKASTSTSESASSSILIPPSSNASPESTSNEIFSPTSPSTAQPSSPPPSKKPRLSIPNYKYSPSLPSPSIKPCPPPVKRSSTSIGLEAINRAESEDSSSSGRISWVLQILSRLSQAERTHEQLSTRRTIHALINYMFKVPNSCPRAGRTVIRLTKNLYCLFPFILQRHMSWMYLALEDRCSLEVGCDSCRDLKSMVATIAQNLSLLAETGYAEGEMCHRLVTKSYSLEEKQAISISAPLLVRQRKTLQNILLNHESLEVMLEVLETETGDVFSHAVLSMSRLAGYLGVVSPDLTLVEDFTSNICSYNDTDHNVALVLDDESRITANKQHLSDSSSVFSAMLSGQFVESDQAEVRIQSSSLPAITCLVHFLYGCRWCPVFLDLGVDILLELVSLTDRFLLPDLNMAVSHEIIRRCMVGDNIIEIYRHSLQKEYPVRSADVTLSACTVSTVLVGDMSTSSRVRLVHLLMQSQLHQDFMDDVSKTIRGKLLQRM